MKLNVLCLLSGLSLTSHGAAEERLYSGYAIVSETPLPENCLVQTVYRNVRGKRVRDGLLEILEGTGYRLAGTAASDPDLHRLLEQPYPNFLRQAGPAPMATVLQRVSGGAWRLVVDPVNRLISFEVHESFDCGKNDTAVCGVQ